MSPDSFRAVLAEGLIIAGSLEYIVVHELVHLLERRHNQRFTALMDRYLPDWRQRRETLKRAALGHEVWAY